MTLQRRALSALGALIVAGSLLVAGHGSAQGQTGKVFGPRLPTTTAALPKTTTATTKKSTARKSTTTTKKTNKSTTKTTKKKTVTTSGRSTVSTIDVLADAGSGSDSGFTLDVVDGLPTTSAPLAPTTKLPPPSVLTLPPTTVPSTTVPVTPTSTTTLPVVLGTPTTTTVNGTSTTVRLASRTQIPGFGEIGFRSLVNGVPQVDVLCAALANTDALRALGLQGRSDLSGYDAMLFAFPADTNIPFTMQNTLLPLSLAWFSADGKLVGSVDMPIVPAGQASPSYTSPGPFRTAIEVPQGRLSAMGFAAGAVLQTVTACRAN